MEDLCLWGQVQGLLLLLLLRCCCCGRRLRRRRSSGRWSGCLLLHKMDDNTINDAVRCEGSAILQDLATEDKFCLLGGDSSSCRDLGAQLIDEGCVRSREGDR